MPPKSHHARVFPAASERLHSLRRQLFELSLLIAVVSTILLRPTYSTKLSFHPSMAPTWYRMSPTTAILSSTVSLMVEFYCDDHLSSSPFECMLIWTPLILLDLSIVELIAGISANASPEHRGILVWHSGGMLTACMCLAVVLAYKWVCRGNAVRVGGLG